MKIKILLPLMITLIMFLQLGLEMTVEHLEDNLQEEQLIIERNNTNLFNRAKSIQLHFKIQVQEWKNILLRGYDRELYKKHLEHFLNQEDATRSNIQALLDNEGLGPEARQYSEEFMRTHMEVGKRYRLIMESHDLENEYRAADKLVQGIDRRLNSLMEHTVAEIEIDRKKQRSYFYESQERTETIIFSVEIAGVLAVIMLLSWLLDRRVVKPLVLATSTARKISKGIFHQSLKVNRHDEIGHLLESLDKMQSSLYSTQHALTERIKEQKALYHVSQLLSDGGKSIDEILQSIVTILSVSWQYPEICCARITQDGKHYQTENFQDSPWKISSKVLINGVTWSVIEVCYLEERPLADNGPFLKEEQLLLDTISQDLSVNIEFRKSIQKHQSLEVQLRQAQKLEAVGQLAAGIAHEINTPAQFVNDNIHFLQETFADYDQLLVAYDRLTRTAASEPVPDKLLNEVKALAEEIDVGYLKEEVPQAITQSLDGLARITRIVQAMKEFSHPGTQEKIPTDLNAAIETTINVSRNEWKYAAELITELDPELPQVPVLPGEFNQVMLNMIVNAAHAITDAVGNSGKKGVIKITTRQDMEWAEITVSDTGKGIPDELQKRIFDPFFTTKEVGKGSGQGLAISWSVIVDKHGGTIKVESEENMGSTFTIRLPLAGSKSDKGKKA